MINLTLTNNSFINIFLIINFCLLTIFPIFYITQNFYAIISLFKRAPKSKESTDFKKFGYVICCHNEEKVIRNLILSLKNQDYPKEKQVIFVILDNCSDRSYEEIKDLGCVIIKHDDLEMVGKSYALDYGLKTILKGHYEDIDAFLFFDADNLVKKDYTRKMNNLYQSGYEVGTSLRNSKNFNENLLTALSGLTFFRECFIVHNARKVLGIGTYVSGTGFFVSQKLIKKLGGFPFHLLIEDIEFSCYCAINKIKIGYEEEAVFYDEQANNLKDLYHQRLRWTKGNHQVYLKYAKTLHASMFKKHSLSSFEMILHTVFYPAIVLIFNLINFIVMGIYSLIKGFSFEMFFHLGLEEVLKYYLILFVMIFLHGLLAYIKGHKYLKGKKGYIILSLFFLPIYLFSLLVVSVISLFKKVKWEKINHSQDISLEDIGEDYGEV